MNISPHPPFYLIGKRIVDKYGRFKGRIISLEFDHSGKLKNIVYVNGGVILSKNIDSIIIKDESIIIAPRELIQSEELSRRLDFIKLQLDTINKIRDLYGNRDIVESLYKKLLDEFNQVKGDVESVLKRIDRRRGELSDRKARIEKLIYWLNVAREANSIDSKVYMDSFEVLDRELIRLNSEYEELEYIYLNLSSKASEIDESIKRLIDEATGDHELIPTRGGVDDS